MKRTITLRYERTDIPPIDMDEAEFRTDSIDTAEIELDVQDCEATLHDVIDEIERLWSENIDCEEVVVPIEDYIRLYGLTMLDSPPHAKPDHKTVEMMVGVDIAVIDEGEIRAVRPDPRRAISHWMFDA